jgi:hypothetical protein
MPHSWFSTIALTLITVIAFLAIGASVMVWRIRTTGASRYGLIAAIAVVASAAVLWIVFMWPVYVD